MVDDFFDFEIFGVELGGIVVLFLWFWLELEDVFLRGWSEFEDEDVIVGFGWGFDGVVGVVRGEVIIGWDYDEINFGFVEGDIFGLLVKVDEV